MAGAWEVYDRCRTDERIAFFPEPDGVEPKLRALARGHQSSPNVWADAYLAAFASTAGLRLVTFDKALGSRSAGCLVPNNNDRRRIMRTWRSQITNAWDAR